MEKSELDIIDKAERYISWALKLIIFGLLITSIFRSRYFLIFSSGAILFLTFLPSIIERNYNIRLPMEFDFFNTLFLWLAFVLGEVNQFYINFPWWDVFLHFMYGVVLSLIGFSIVYILFYTKKVQASPAFSALFTIAFAISLGALWEIFEFSMDSLFGFHMQETGLVDTMWDLIVDTLGAMIVGVSGYLYIKNPRKGLIDRILKKIVLLNKDKLPKKNFFNRF